MESTTKNTQVSSLCEERLSAGRPLSANLEGGQPLFKQCRVCKFTRQIKMFQRHKMYNDGYESQCRYCKKAARIARRLARQAVVLVLALLCGTVFAQEPEYLGETYVNAAIVYMRPNSSRAAVYFNTGFGTYPITLTSTTNWKLTVGIDPYKYAMFRIRDGVDGIVGDYWVTERATWTAYLTHKNAATLKAASWQFQNFTLTSDYTLPDFVMPVAWEERTGDLVIGHSLENTLIAVKRKDNTWEWVVRGVKDSGAWQSATTKEQAMMAAHGFLGG